MAQCMNAKGELPNYGSNDVALILPGALAGYRDFRQAINAAYALAAGKRLWSDQALSEQLLWHGVYPLPAVTELTLLYIEHSQTLAFLRCTT